MARTLEEVQATGSREETERLVGALHLDWFRLAEHDALRVWDYAWVDEHGLSEERPVHAFMFGHGNDPIAGRCVIYGVRMDGGATCDAAFPMDVLHQEVTWLGQIIPHVQWTETEGTLRSVVSFERVS